MTPEQKAEWIANVFLSHGIIPAEEFEDVKASALTAMQKNIYDKVCWKEVDAKDPILFTEPTVGLAAEAFIALREQERSNQQKYNDAYMKIIDRYAFENKWREYWTPSDRRDYTPKQKRRIRKQTAKYRRRFLGENY